MNVYRIENTALRRAVLVLILPVYVPGALLIICAKEAWSQLRELPAAVAGCWAVR